MGLSLLCSQALAFAVPSIHGYSTHKWIIAARGSESQSTNTGKIYSSWTQDFPGEPGGVVGKGRAQGQILDSEPAPPLPHHVLMHWLLHHPVPQLSGLQNRHAILCQTIVKDNVHKTLRVVSGIQCMLIKTFLLPNLNPQDSFWPVVDILQMLLRKKEFSSALRPGNEGSTRLGD